MVNDLLDNNNDKKYLVFDTETCSLGLSDLNNKPWQLGMLVCQGTQILKKELFYIRWPDLKLSEDAARITRFNQKEYDEKAEDSIKVLDYFESYLYNKDYLIMAHNGLGFDVYIHSIWRLNLGLKRDWSYLPRFIDTNALAKGIKLHRSYRPGDNLLAYQYSMLSIVRKDIKTNLKHLSVEFDIPSQDTELHSGLYDCLILWRIWNKWLKWQVEI